MATKKSTKSTTDNVVDLDLSVTRKKRFRIDKDNNRILELNTADMNIVTRLSECYPRFDSIMEKVAVIQSTSDDFQTENADDVIELGKSLKELDAEMRDLVDTIFDSNVSEICAPDGSMYDLFDGVLRYEHIINTLIPLYEDNLDKELSNIKNRVKKHTNKYTRG